MIVTALIYVNDVILTGNDNKLIHDVKKYLDHKFSIKDMGTLKYFLGIKVARSSKDIFLNQRKYAIVILKETMMENRKPSPSPIEQNCNLRSNDGKSDMDASRYKITSRILLYLIITRPNITYIVNTPCQDMANPKQIHDHGYGKNT